MITEERGGGGAIFREKRKVCFFPSDFHLFCETENAQNSDPSHSSENKKSAEFRSERFSEEKKSELKVISFRTIPKKD
jgi:hypothetical protein